MGYTVAQAAKRMNLTAYTIRYYDREGLLPNVERDKAGNRIFNRDDMETLALICCLKRTGMPIREIKQFTDWQNEGNRTLHAREAMLLEHRDKIGRQIDDLKKNLSLLARKLEYYHDACEAYDAGAPVPICCECALLSERGR